MYSINMTREGLKKHCWVDKNGDEQMPLDEVECVIRGLIEDIRSSVSQKHSREMSPGENRSKYLAFQRGANYFRKEVLKILDSQ